MEAAVPLLLLPVLDEVVDPVVDPVLVLLLVVVELLAAMKLPVVVELEVDPLVSPPAPLEPVAEVLPPQAAPVANTPRTTTVER